MLSINKEGDVRFGGARLKVFFQKHAGTWRVVSTIPGLLVFQRKDSGVGGAEPVPLFAGETRRRGWMVDVVGFIATSKLSGELIVLSEGVQRELFFEHGALRMASSSAKADLLGEFMVSEGVLSQEQLNQALAARSADKRLGQVLVEMGFLSGPDVYKVLTRKLTKIFIDAVSVAAGAYYFLGDIDLTRLPASMYMDTQAMLLESVRRIDDQDFYSQNIPRLRPGVLNDLTRFSDGQQRLLAAIDGAGTFAALDQHLNMGMEQMVATAHDLASMGAIEVLSKSTLVEQSVRGIVDAYNNALSQVYAALESPSAVAEVIGQTTAFIKGPSHGNQTLAGIELDGDGKLTLENIFGIARAANEREPAVLVVMVLTQLFSFVLFTANARLPIDRQQQLSASVNESVADVLSRYVG